MTRDLLLVVSSLFVWGLGEGMFLYFQPLYLQKLGADPLKIGAILGAMGVAMVVAQIPAGYIADRWGRRPVMLASWILGATAAWIMALSGSLSAFSVGLILYGFTTFVLSPMNSYISAARGRWSVGRALTTASALYNLGAVIGPLLGGYLGTRLGMQSVYITAAAILVISTLVVFFIRPQPIHAHHESGHITLILNWRFAGVLLLAFFTTYTLYLPQPLTPNYLQNQHQLSLQSIGQLGSVGSLGNVVLALALGRLTPWLGLFLGQVTMGLFAILMWKGTGIPWFAAGYFFAGGYRLCRSMLMTIVRPMVPPGRVGLAFGLLETVNSVAIFLAPTTAGFLYEASPTSVYTTAFGLTCGLLLLTGGLLSAQRLRKIEIRKV